MNRYFGQQQSADSPATAKLVTAYVKPNNGNCPGDAIKMTIEGEDACRTVCWDTDDKSRPEGKKDSKTTIGQCSGYPGLTYTKGVWAISGPGQKQSFNHIFDVLDGTQNRCDTVISNNNLKGFDDDCCHGVAGRKCERKGQDDWGWTDDNRFPYDYSATPPQTCPGTPACSGHGTCSGGLCSCTLNTGWTLKDCSQCASGWKGANCDRGPSECSVSTLQYECQGNKCVQTCCPDHATCKADSSCDGACKAGPPSDCGQPLQWECQGNKCTQTCCPDDTTCYSDSTCEGKCETVTPPTCLGEDGNCSGHGTCLTSGQCSCDPGWDPPDCSRYSGTEGDKGGGSKGIVVFLSVIAGIIFLVIIGMIVFLFISSRKPKGAAGVSAGAAEEKRPRKKETIYY